MITKCSWGKSHNMDPYLAPSKKMASSLLWFDQEENISGRSVEKKLTDINQCLTNPANQCLTDV